LNITIRNLCPDLELTSLVYFSDCIACHVSPSHQIDTNSTMVASFGIDKQDYFKGVLLYKLQRKHTCKTDNQPNSSTASIKDALANTYLLVVWDNGGEWTHYGFYVYLIEYTSDPIWNENKLWALHRKYGDKFHNNYKDSISTWLMNDGILMKTRSNMTYGSDYKWDITISEGVWERNMLKPMKINPKRLVLSLSMLIVLMYAVRFRARFPLKLNIHNQCLNVDLVSPIYFTRCDLECYRPPDYKVCAGDITRSGFISRKGKEFYGILIYRIQRRQSHESTEISEDTSSAAHLLVAWRFDSNDLYVDALMVEYDEGFIRDEYKLRKLYDENIYLSILHLGSTTEVWSLDNNAGLIAAFEIMNKDCTVNITISEVEKYHSMRTPIHIDLRK
jgi:hypothetical protein